MSVDQAKNPEGCGIFLFNKGAGRVCVLFLRTVSSKEREGKQVARPTHTGEGYHGKKKILQYAQTFSPCTRGK
jgi:hypothetical protein